MNKLNQNKKDENSDKIRDNVNVLPKLLLLTG